MIHVTRILVFRLSSIPPFLSPVGATAKGAKLRPGNYASGASRVANGTRYCLILDQQNDIVRSIPYTRLTSLFCEARGSIGGGNPLPSARVRDIARCSHFGGRFPSPDAIAQSRSARWP
jgi:hypothetical protein